MIRQNGLPFSRAGLVVATALVVATPLPAGAQMRLYTGGAKAAEARANLPGEARTAAGELLVPRYLQAPGDHELALDQSAVVSATPNSLGGPFLARVSATLKVLPLLDLHMAIGPWTRVVARGPIFKTASLGLGWSAGYRSDLVATGRTLASGDFTSGAAPPGTSQPLGFWAEPGVAVARGGEIRLEGLNRIAVDAGFLDLGLSPFGYSLGNRSGGGADLTLDWALERVTVGYTGTVQYNAVKPFDPASPIAALELQHALGARVLMGDRNFVQAGYRFVQTDTYNNTWHLLTVGLGFRSAPAPAPQGEEEGSEAPPGKMKTSE